MYKSMPRSRSRSRRTRGSPSNSPSDSPLDSSLDLSPRRPRRRRLSPELSPESSFQKSRRSDQESEQESGQGTIFLFTHSNRIKCLLKESLVLVESEDGSSSMSIKETLETHKGNQKTFKKYFNNITFHIKKNPSGQYEITVLDAGSIRSSGNKIGNEDLSYYRGGTIDSPEIDYLTILKGPLTKSLKDNNIESIVISRHGRGRHNDWMDPRNTFAISDARLTDKGEQETVATAERVKRIIDNLNIDEIKIPAPTYVFTSELFRTMQTAALFMKKLGYVDSTTQRTFYIVRCNHELSSAQEKEGKCNSSIDTILNSEKSLADAVKYRLRMGDENYPKRLGNKIKSFCAQLRQTGEECKDKKEIILTSTELNCSTRNYTERCDKKGNMFYNINIVFYRNQRINCENYNLFKNIRDIISGSVGEMPGGTIRKSMKRNKKRKTLRRKSKRLTKKRNSRRTNKRRTTNKRKTNKKKRFTKRR